jgi:hypothetical protein
LTPDGSADEAREGGATNQIYPLTLIADVGAGLAAGEWYRSAAAIAAGLTIIVLARMGGVLRKI